MAFKIQDTTVIDDDRNASFANLARVRQPTNVSPANNASNVQMFPVELTASNYSSLYGKLHANSQFQLSNVIDFATVVYDSGNIAANVANVVSVVLAADTEHFFRVRYSDNENNTSEFSVTTGFTTANVIINTPSLTVTGSPDAVIETPTLATGAFSFTGTGLNPGHVSTDWQVLRTSNSQIVFERPANTVNLTSIVVPAATLEANVQYEFRARHNSNVAGSSQFASNTGTTVAVFGPTVLGESFGGGFYTGTINIGGGVCYFLIVAPNSTGCASCQWKTTRTATSGTGSCVNGFTNTYPPLANASHPAGNWTATRTIAGFSDWYLPARDELNVLFTNKGSMPAGEGYASVLYWSSTENGTSLDLACAQNFNSGTITNGFKADTYRVRAVRRIPI